MEPAERVLHEIMQDECQVRLEVNEFWEREKLRGEKDLGFLGFRNEINKNISSGIEDDLGRWMVEPNIIDHCCPEYFESIFSTVHPQDFETALSPVDCQVSEKSNCELLHEPRLEKFHEAVFQMFPTKAPSPSGMSAFFYQKRWSTEGVKLLAFAMLATRLFPSHASHSFKAAEWSGSGSMAIKLDMSKAYDGVKWSFLRAIMLKMGFTSRWVDLIMVGVSSVSYSVVVNGGLKGKIVPSRKLRQGDPLSPYLFVL
ncbi:uncharacterized protein LOC120007324 [Tripterygium wilfordii]|uniref:uncharacterized protein LOC120007324 n=1 Tax=Tripterygium wilfordii TaxID=458696 RepID=UPI0018F83F80|nr:uncharacterized protein LOC120007324 [Tripterygium wilfordii]